MIAGETDIRLTRGLELLRAGALAEAAALAARMTLESGDGPAAWRLAWEVARAGGDLLAAAEAARCWQALAPRDPDALHAQALFNGGQPARQTGVSQTGVSQTGAVPFLVLDDFLSPFRHAEVVDYFLEVVPDLLDASVVEAGGQRVQDQAVRSARVGYDPGPLRGWFLPLVEAQFPLAFARLGVAPFAPARVELQLTASYHGDFYRAHRDYDPLRPSGVETRRLSFVYYFRPEGGVFQEGALRLYDAEAGKDARLYTAILPLDNRLIVFPSQALHEVMPVRALSGRVQDGRFTLNGWANLAAETGEGS